jgi:hypothetical protein
MRIHTGVALALVAAISCGGQQEPVVKNGNGVVNGGKHGPCKPAPDAVATADQLRRDGRLLGALAAAETIDKACPSAEGKRRIAELLEEGWSYERAVAAWKDYAAADPAGKAAADQAIARLQKRRRCASRTPPSWSAPACC